MEQIILYSRTRLWVTVLSLYCYCTLPVKAFRVHYLSRLSSTPLMQYAMSVIDAEHLNFTQGYCVYIVLCSYEFCNYFLLVHKNNWKNYTLCFGFVTYTCFQWGQFS